MDPHAVIPPSSTSSAGTSKRAGVLALLRMPALVGGLGFIVGAVVGMFTVGGQFGAPLLVALAGLALGVLTTRLTTLPRPQVPRRARDGAPASAESARSPRSAEGARQPARGARPARAAARAGPAGPADAPRSKAAPARASVAARAAGTNGAPDPAADEDADWTVPPGWYPDPRAPGGTRYWDGFRWTDRVRPAGAPPEPARADVEGTGASAAISSERDG